MAFISTAYQQNSFESAAEIIIKLKEIIDFSTY